MNELVQAVVAEPSSPHGWAHRTVDAVEPLPGQLLVDVRHVSLNHGDLRYARIAASGTVLGWDATGIVSRPAADGQGPAIGTPVVAFGAGAWAQRAAFDLDNVAALPVDADLATLAALPLAGFTALRSLRAAGPTLGRRVLVTGASGGVGGFAVQLAALGGAHVVASTSRPERAATLRKLGADEIVTGPDQVEQPVDIVIDNVGGPQLVAAFALLAPGGSLQSVGWSAGEPAEFAPYSTFGPAKTLTTFADASAVGTDLAFLARLVIAGRLTVEVGRRVSWEQLDEAAEALSQRRIVGKVVLDLA